MNIRPGPSFQDTEELKAPETWVRPNKTTAVLDLLEKLCPKELPCSDVDRAILGASLGG